MKTMNRFFRNLIVITMVAVAAPVFAESIPQYINILKVDGGARYSTDGGKNWTMLKSGDVLNPGSLIQTAEKGTVKLLMGPELHLVAPAIPTVSSPLIPPSQLSKSDVSSKNNVVCIFPGAVLLVDKLICEKTGIDEVSETQLDLKAGRIMGNVKKLSAASRYEIKTPSGIAGIRGTAYVIGADSRIYVIDGSIVISYVDPDGSSETVIVLGGYSFDPSLPPGQRVNWAGPPEQTLQIDEVYVPPANPTIDHTVYHISPN